MKHIILIIIMDGLANGVLTSSLMHILPSSENSDLVESFAVLAFGLGTVSIIYASTRISDYIEYRT